MVVFIGFNFYISNEAKFPNGYLFELSDEEWNRVKTQFATSPQGVEK
jgi:hypothetical protein